MITERQMRTLFTQANPIPDPDAVRVDEMAATAYLANLETRSSQMTQLETRPEGQKDKKLSPMTWLAAAAAVIVVTALGVLINRNTTEVADGPPTIVYTGNECAYQGQTEFEVGTEVTFSFLDNVDRIEGVSVGFGIWRLPEGMTVQEILDEGMMNNGAQVETSALPTADGLDLTVTFDEPGLYAANCADRTEGQPPADYANLFTVNP